MKFNALFILVVLTLPACQSTTNSQSKRELMDASFPPDHVVVSVMKNKPCDEFHKVQYARLGKTMDLTNTYHNSNNFSVEIGKMAVSLNDRMFTQFSSNFFRTMDIVPAKTSGVIMKSIGATKATKEDAKFAYLTFSRPVGSKSDKDIWSFKSCFHFQATWCGDGKLQAEYEQCEIGHTSADGKICNSSCEWK